jgi:hypothetical protein
MKAKPVDSMRPGDSIYEIKFDGYRASALRGGLGRTPSGANHKYHNFAFTLSIEFVYDPKYSSCKAMRFP